MQTVSDIASSLLIVVITIVFMDSVLELRVKRRYPWMIGALFFLLAEVMECMRLNKEWMAVATILMMASICICYRNKSRIMAAVVFLAISLFLSEPAAYYAVEILTQISFPPRVIEFLDLIKPLLPRALAIILLYFCSHLFNLLYQSGALPLRRILGCVLIPLFSLGQIYINYHMFFYEPTAGLTLLTTVFTFVNNIVAFQMLILVKEHYDGQIDSQKKAEQLDAFYYQQRKLVEEQISVRRVQHDMENILLAIYTSLKDGNYQEPLTIIEKELKTLSPAFDPNTGLFSVDAIINYKARDAQKIGATLEVRHKIDQELNLRWTAVGIILSTALDNAIEACSRNPADKRTIRIKIGTHNQMLRMEISNPYTGDLQSRPDGLYATTKKEQPLHGYGIDTITRVVKSNKGHCDFLVNDNIFSVSVLLSEDPDSISHHKTGRSRQNEGFAENHMV